jgi:hypothetical protein
MSGCRNFRLSPFDPVNVVHPAAVAVFPFMYGCLRQRSGRAGKSRSYVSIVNNPLYFAPFYRGKK